MHKYFRSIGLFLLLFVPIFLLNLYLSRTTPVLQSGAVLPAQVTGHGYLLQEWEHDGQEWRFSFSGKPEEPISLITADISRPFSVAINGETIYQYDKSSQYSRTRQIPLPVDTLKGENVLTITGLPYRTSYKFLLGAGSTITDGIREANRVEMVALGAYIAILIHSISLYFRKRSEKYLLLLAFLAVLALTSYLSNSALFPSAVSISQPIRFLRTSFSVVLICRLSRVPVGKKLRAVISIPGCLIFTGLMMLLYVCGLVSIYDPITYALAIPAILAVIYGCAEGFTGSTALMAGTAMMESLRMFNFCYNTGRFPVPIYAFYLYLPQLYNILFALGCMVSIDCLFAEKFQQADQLAVGLEEKVARRTEDLQAANARIQDLQRRKDQMTTEIYHDLRTPIFIAQGSADMLQVEGEKNTLYLETIRNRLGHLHHLTEELFLLAKLEDKAITFDFFWIDLNPLAQSVLDGFRTEADKKGVALCNSIPPGLKFSGDS